MRAVQSLYRAFLCWILILGCAVTAKAQANYYDIAPVNGNFSFNYNQTPDDLVPIFPSFTGAGYQWYWSTEPTTNFQPITGKTSPTLQFNTLLDPTLDQTMYFKRQININGVWFFSNIVKIEVVSVNWENVNYLREHSVLKAGITDWKAVDNLPIGDKMQKTVYLDGLGRPIQTVSRETATPSAAQPNLWGDIVQFNQYDLYGRESKQYLPYTSTSQSGKIKTSPDAAQTQYYTNLYDETSAYNQLTFENSPLNRVLNLKASGTAWAASAGRGANYDLNDENDDVRIFTIGYTSNDVPVTLAEYLPRTLFKNESIDENGKKVVEFINKSGQLVLKKVQLEDVPAGAHDGWICTYAVYDDFGQQRFVIQPEAVKWLEAHSWSFNHSEGPTVLQELCFRYEYDEQGRNIVKKAPGAKELYMIYDQRDRVVFMQDGNQRIKQTPEWTMNLYDVLDRPVITSLYQTNKSIAALSTDIQNAVTITNTTPANSGAVADLSVSSRNTAISHYEATNSIEFLPDFESVPGDEFTAEVNPNAASGNLEVGIVTYTSPVSEADLNNPSINTIVKYFYFDNYAYPGAKNFNSAFDNALAYSTGDPIATSYRTISMPTGSKARVLGTSTFLTSTIYYDDKSRPIQTIEDNIKSGIDIVTLQYQFDGRLLSSNTKHTANNTSYTNYSTVTKNIFDKIGRVIGIEKKFGSNPFKSIASYGFDDMGRLKSKRLAPGYTGGGKNEMEELKYSYNIHNEITGINKDYALKTAGEYSKWGHFFGLYLGFDNRDGVFANSNLSGQVTGALWSSQGDDAQRKYDFSYDNAGRLVNASYKEKEKLNDNWNTTKTDFSVTGNSGKITYSLNGNLINMIQKGIVIGNPTPLNIDNLTYTYFDFSNKLKKVVDNGTLGTTNGKLGDFSDGANGSNDDYVYDDNGNLIIDLNKNVTDLDQVNGGKGIKYNFLDKPEEIRIKGKGLIKIVYDADGNKLQKLFTPEGGGTTTTTTYISGYVYKGDELQYINFEEGRIRVMQAVNQNNGFDFLTLDGNMDLPGNKRGAVDFYIRDYQQNVRMIVTEQTQSGTNVCTMETNRAANEESLFGKVDANGNPLAGNEVQARFATSSIPGQSNGNGWQHPAIANHVSRIGNLAGSKVGPNSLLRVMAGDEVSATSIYYYQTPVTNQSGGPTVISELLLSLGQAITGSSVTTDLTKAAASNITSQINGNSLFNSLTDPDIANSSGTNPKAYLKILFFDERFNFVEEGSTSIRVSQSGNGASPLVLSNIKAPKNGYAYVCVTNVSDEMVYFDNLQVAHVRGRIVEENHYYAYGLRIAGISSRKVGDVSEGMLENKNFYNDKELFEEADLDWYDYGFRNYDAQIGRFTQLDPLTFEYQFLTPYQFAGNEPIANIDIDGLEPGNAISAGTAFTYSITQSSTRMWLPMSTRVASAAAATTKGASIGVSLFSISMHAFATILFQPTPNQVGLPKLIGRSRSNQLINASDGQTHTHYSWPGWNNKSEKELLHEMMSLVLWASNKNQQMASVALDMTMKFFKNGNTGENLTVYSNPTLTAAVKNDLNYKGFVKNIYKKVHNMIKTAGGDIKKFRTFEFENMAFTRSENHSDGLGITMHGISNIKVSLVSFTLDGQTGKYNAKVKFELEDNFGLGEEDVIPTKIFDYRRLDGFKAWFLLQHRYGHSPLRTYVVTEESYTGNINDK